MFRAKAWKGAKGELIRISGFQCRAFGLDSKREDSSYLSVEAAMEVNQRPAKSLESEAPVVKPGWDKAPKGLLQVLWERGWVKPDKVNGFKLKSDDENYSLRCLMSQCEDF